MKAHCLFEQSGTFKNEFVKLGIPAEDYDIQNEFGETDHVVDLFEEIRGGYDGKPSIFDGIEKDDIVMAFFPCVRFSTMSQMLFKGENWQQKKQTDKQKLEYDLELHAELSRNYELITKLALIAIDRGLKLIIENPYTQPHYLTDYWCLKPALIDKDRTENGDYYQKPTQFFFINFEPKQTLLFEPLDEVETKIIGKVTNSDGLSRQTLRSMIHPQYARRFIKQYLL